MNGFRLYTNTIFHLSFIFYLISLVFSPKATFSQVQHPINIREIPLDDFPALISGYRIQVGAFSSQNSALQVKKQLGSKLMARTHLRFEDGLWRVRVGDFADSVSALKYWREELPEHWRKKAAMVPDFIPISPDSLPVPPTIAGYRLQVYALKDKDQAKLKARDLTCLFPKLKVHILPVDSLFKIQLGDFTDSSNLALWKKAVTGVADLQPMVVRTQVFNQPLVVPDTVAPKDIFQYDD